MSFWIAENGGVIPRNTGGNFAVDTRVVPHRLVLNERGEPQRTVIFKFEGSTLVLKIPMFAETGVPKDFGVEPKHELLELERF